MSIWNVKQTIEFQVWFEEADTALQEDTVEHVELIKQFGPYLKRPYADTLKGSQLTNLKELRFSSGNKNDQRKIGKKVYVAFKGLKKET